MPIGSKLTVELDVPGPTMAHPPMWDGFDFSWARGTAGEQWPSPGWWICPLTGHLQIRPIQMTHAWATSTTGAFARPRKSDWNLTDADWAEIEFRAAYDYFLLSRGTNAEISTHRRFPEGQPLWLELRAFATSGDRMEMARVTFGQYTVRLYSTGEAKVTGGSLPQEGRIGYITRHPRDISGEFVQLYIQPLGDRRICFYSPSHEWGWVLHAAVHAAGPLKLQFPLCQGMALAMPAVFPQDPVEFITPVRHLPVAPRPSQAPEIGLDEWDVPPGCGVVASCIEAESDSGIAWDGTKRAYRVKYVMLSGTEPGQNPDGRPSWTPTVYGVRIRMPGESAQRTGTPLDVTGDVAELELRFSDGRRGAGGALQLRGGENYGGTTLLHNRLVRIRAGEVPVFLGFANDPARTFGHNPQARRASWQLEGVLALRARTTQMPAHGPFDGEALEEVVRYLLGLLGATEDQDIELPDLSGLKMPSGTRGSPVCPVEAGQTVEHWLERIESLFGYAVQERPRGNRWVFRMYHPADDAGDPVKTFYLSDAERQAAGAARHTLAWSYEERAIRPEVNTLAVDYCTPEGEHTLMQVIDTDAQDPLKPVNQRPRNWTGERMWALLRESRIRRDDDIRRMLAALIERPGVMDPVRIAVWTAEWDPDVWPGDRVTVHGRGIYRVTEVSVQVVRDHEVFYHRPATYTGEMRDAG